MLLSSETMRILLLACLVGMAVMSVFYLRQRNLSFWTYIAWALVAILLPLVGPFLVIYLHPGKTRLISKR